MVQAGEDGPDLGGDMGKDGGMIAVPNWIADMSDMKTCAVTVTYALPVMQGL